MRGHRLERPSALAVLCQLIARTTQVRQYTPAQLQSNECMNLHVYYTCKRLIGSIVIRSVGMLGRSKPQRSTQIASQLSVHDGLRRIGV